MRHRIAQSPRPARRWPQSARSAGGKLTEHAREPGHPPPENHDAKVESPLSAAAPRLPITDRSGSETQVIAHIPLSQLGQMPDAEEIEHA